MQEKFQSLQEPLTARDIEIKIGHISANGASLLLYKTARVDAKRLDSVFSMRWQRKHYADSRGAIICAISIYDDEIKEWISREDVGESNNKTEKDKSAYSDSFKRAGSSWGIGRELYEPPFVFIGAETIQKPDGKYELKDKFAFSKTIVKNYEVKNGLITKIIIHHKQKDYTFFQNDITFIADIDDDKKMESEKTQSKTMTAEDFFEKFKVKRPLSDVENTLEKIQAELNAKRNDIKLSDTEFKKLLELVKQEYTPF